MCTIIRIDEAKCLWGLAHAKNNLVKSIRNSNFVVANSLVVLTLVPLTLLRCTLMVPGLASTRSASRMKLCASLPKSVGILRIGLAIIMVCFYCLNE